MLASSWSAVSVAADTARVAVIHARDDEPFRRVRGELAAAGLSTVDVPSSGSDTRAASVVARESGAVAAVRIVSADEIELVIVEPDSGKLLYQKSVRAAPSGDPLALRAVEDLRARLVKLRLAPPEAGEAAANEEPPRAAMPRPPELDRGGSASPHGNSLWAGAALGASVSGGGLGVDLAVHTGLRYDFGSRWAASLSALLPVASQSVSDVGAHADVRVYAIDALAHFTLVDRGAWSADVGVGAALVAAKMEGFAETPAVTGRSDTVWSGAPLVDVSASVRPSSMLRLRAELFSGVAMPRPSVVFEDRSVAVWGRPFAVALLGAEIAIVPEANGGER